MPGILSVATKEPPYTMTQQETMEIVKNLFEQRYPNIDRLLTIFDNGQIKKRNFVVPKEWFKEEHSFKDKNDIYIKEAIELSVDVIRKCLENSQHLKRNVSPAEIAAIIFVSSTGIATPSIEARVMNRLPFSKSTKRIPIWGLGCAGGVAGIARAFEYCKAYPFAKVLVINVELCSLTFMKDDMRKSNIIGTSLFADGVACTLVGGDEVLQKEKLSNKKLIPYIVETESQLLRDSEQIMGWNVVNEGLQVVFSKDIPTVIKEWLKPNTLQFLEKQGYNINNIAQFIAHPGGKKVLEAYEETLSISTEMTRHARKVLQEHGNMSSPTVIYVLQETMNQDVEKGDVGLMVALGPGFCSELALLRWEEVE
ncbi:type III polyketide synthase [Evansella cellulosilytica]|uniref:Chalcone and stilbene synthase domain protein n=1 Tax=Evansella cellulosilytica (strain ATCC 21833 / DSM 2522 / FERM P-1141 / JCM 9156 / N-4) TaxID=649639 RepID=E6TVX9_EVAC2|nr:3-oxoacyl-[acyl-carrier-protein] synthase III C-terminal domain-containing protein [Evansella cellulosilytica]ADU28688.1 chalcone and stilbene synthase domain protein [Evansella cellulosilytica DSM 2522]